MCTMTRRSNTPEPSHRLDGGNPYSLPVRLLASHGNGEKLLTPKDVAEIFQVSQTTLERWRREGNGPKFLKFSRGRSSVVRYQLDAILAHVEQAVRRSTCDPGPS
jgi:transposase